MDLADTIDSNATTVPQGIRAVLCALLLLVGILLGTYVVISIMSTNSFPSSLCLPLAGAIGCGFVGSLVNTKWVEFAGWASLALIGQAASLQMIDAGRRIHFQHYRQIEDLVTNDPHLLAILLIYGVIVVFGLLAGRQEVAEWVRRFGVWKLATVGGFVALGGAAVTPDAGVYLTSLGLGTWVQVIGIANCLLIAISVPVQALDRLKAFFSRLIDGPEPAATTFKLDAFAWKSSVIVICVTALLSYFVYEASPHVPDETQYLFQAKYMAAGQLTVNPPRVPEAFAIYMVPYLDEKWHGIFPPAFPAILAVGIVAGAPWLVNPLLAGICILLSYLFLRQLYSRTFARIGLLLLCSSPWFIFMGMNFMSHMFTLALALSAALIMLRAVDRNRLAYAVVSGAFAGAVFMVRPLDGAVLAALVALWAILRTDSWTRAVKMASGLGIGVLSASLLILPYNRVVTGSWVTMPLEAYYAKYFTAGAIMLGFGPDRGLGWALDAFPGHSPTEALINTSLNVFQVNTELFGWSIGSLAFVFVVFVHRRLSKQDLWAVGCIAAFAAMYGLFWYHGGPDFGARYWFLLIIPFLVLTLRGLQTVSEISGSSVGEAPSPRVMLVTFSLCLITLVSYVPWRAADKYFRYLNIHPEIGQFVNAKKFGHDLVLIRGTESPDYQGAWVWNPQDFGDSGPLLAWDKTPEIRRALIRAYPERKVWIVDGPTLANGNYVVRRGPIDGELLLREQDGLTHSSHLGERDQ